MVINITTGANRFAYNWEAFKIEKALELTKDKYIHNITIKETATGMNDEEINDTVYLCLANICAFELACPDYAIDAFYIDITNQVLLYRLVTKLKETYPNARILSSITRKVKTYYTGANGKIVNKPTYVFKDFIDF